MPHLLAIDPGRSKCGLVLGDLTSNQVLVGLVLPAERVLDQIELWNAQAPIHRIVLGNGTGSADWEQRLRPLLPVELVEERGTTLRARARYWMLRPPQGWRRLLPEGLRLPPIDLDAFAALVLLEDHLGVTLDWPDPLRNGHAP
jgi:RNase H-fold protein (predicted Holliday junction resolvase)